MRGGAVAEAPLIRPAATFSLREKGRSCQFCCFCISSFFSCSFNSLIRNSRSTNGLLFQHVSPILGAIQSPLPEGEGQGEGEAVAEDPLIRPVATFSLREKGRSCQFCCFCISSFFSCSFNSLIRNSRSTNSLLNFSSSRFFFSSARVRRRTFSSSSRFCWICSA